MVHYGFFTPKDPEIRHRINELFDMCLHINNLFFDLFYIIEDLMREPCKIKHYDFKPYSIKPYFSKVQFCRYPDYGAWD